MESGKILWMSLAVLFSFIASVSSVREPAAKQLFHDLMKKQDYNRLIKPSGGPSAKLTVKIGLRLSQLLNVDEKNQIMTTSVWLRQQWYDPRLRWDPDEYGGVTKLHIPSNDLWRPDIVLYNNADGEFVITLMTKATVFSNGHIVWEPPAIYKSYCPIDVEFFPFDMQECFLKFSSWTYDGTELDLQHICDGVEISSDGNGKNQEVVIPRGIDLKDYYFNVEWDVINVTARRKNKFYPCCSEPYPDIMFNITLRRRTLFYTLNLIMPCISISCLTILVFYLPSDSGEKITLSISILLALTVFFLLLAEIIPPTSLVIPLIGKYLLFIMIVVTMSIFLTVYTLHINFKTPTTAEMSPWVRRVFTEILPKILFIKRPLLENSPTLARQSCNGIDSREEGSPPKDWHTYENLRQHTPPEGQEAPPPPRPVRVRYPREVSEALAGVKFIANHITKADEENAEVQDWKYIAMVMDRLFLYIFTTACFSGTVSIFLYAPSLYDHRQPMDLIDLNSSCVY